MFTIVAALKAEVQPILNFLGEAAVSCLGEGTLYAYEHVHVLRLGIGGPKASETLRTYLGWYEPAFILNIGLAGALHTSLLPQQVLRILTVESEETAQSIPLPFHAKLKDLQPAHLLTVNQPVTDATRRENLLHRFQADLVDMEGFHLARVCRSYSLPFYAVKAVSDFADKDSAAQLRSHYKACAQHLLTSIQPFFEPWP